MASKDRSKSESTAGPKDPRKKKQSASRARSKTAPPKIPPTAEPSAGPASEAPVKPEPEASTGPTDARPSTASAASDADLKPLHPGIDAMAILDKAETGKRADAPAEETGARPGMPPSAAEVIARSISRDHPDRGGAPAREPAQPEGEVTPRLTPKTPLPLEPEEPIGGVGPQGLPPPLLEGEDAAAILNADHAAPFAFLGMHTVEPKGLLTVRVFLPDATAVKVIDAGSGEIVTELEQAHDEGLFIGEIPGRKQPFPYRLRVTGVKGSKDIDDPYRFPPVLSDKDVRQLAKGEHLASYRVLGAHPTELDGVKGVSFAVWAPNASHVSVVGDFNGWDGRRHSMRPRRECGVWEIFLPGVSTGAFYKYEIKSAPDTAPSIKSDPYAFYAERPPGFASIIEDIKEFRWRDGTWMKSRKERHGADAALSFYEVHLGSWRRKPEEENRYLSYRELAEELVRHASDLGFSHIALLPLSEHTYDGTLGFLPSALYAPTSRFGTPDDFRHFVDTCHRAGIGVVADWVPNYLSEEPNGLSRFDGTPLYEHPDPHQGRDPDWNTPIYNFARPQVVNYLLGNALYWLDHFHLDGLRIDGLAKLLYLDYGRGEGQWTPNKEGGNENLEALAFVRRFNELVAKKHPGVITIAEDSSLRQGLTRPVKDGGLGFGLRWNSAWAYDTLRYLGRHPVHRKYYQFELTNPLLYAFDEEFVLPLSHDHVSMGQGSMLNKMRGDHWQKFATLRAWYALMYALPGKKLMFMGTEFAQDREWNSDISLDWHLTEDPLHRGMMQMVRDLNGLYRKHPALHESDCDPKGFEWIDFADEDNSVIAFIRYAKDRKKHVVVVSHFTPAVLTDYRIGVPKAGRYQEVLNTDAVAYGGGNVGSAGAAAATDVAAHGRDCSLSLTLPPYATVVLAPDDPRKSS